MQFQFRKIGKEANQSGFSLMELMIVVAIIAILAAIAIPNAISWRTNSQFNGSVRQVKSGIADMRMHAIKNNTRADVIFPAAGAFLTVEWDRVAGALVPNFEVQQLAPGMTVGSTFPGNMLTFNNRGMTANFGAVTINGPGGMNRTITVSIAGSSRIQ